MNINCWKSKFRIQLTTYFLTRWVNMGTRTSLVGFDPPLPLPCSLILLFGSRNATFSGQSQGFLSHIPFTVTEQKPHIHSFSDCQAHYCKQVQASLIPASASRQRLRSATRNQLIVPRHRRSRFGRRAFSVAGPMVWNLLPDHLRDPSLSIGSFRSALKTFLFTMHRDT